MLNNGLSVIACKSQAEMSYGLIRKSPVLQISQAFLAMGRIQVVHEKEGCIRIDLSEYIVSRPSCSVLSCLLLALYFHSGSLGKTSDCLGKGCVFILHDKAYDIASLAAPEAVIHLLGRIDGKGGCLLIMERAQPPVIIPFFLKRDITAHNIGYVVACLYFLYKFI